MLRDGIYRELSAAAGDCPASLADATVPHYPLLWISEAFTTLTGFQRSEVVGRSLAFFDDPALVRDASERLRMLLRDGPGPVSLGMTTRLRSGETLRTQTVIEQIQDESGRPLFLLGVHGPEGSGAVLSEARRRLVDALMLHRRELFSAGLLTGHVTDRVLQSLFTGIIAVNRLGSVIYANNAALAVLERTIKDSLGRCVAELLGARALEMVLTGTRAEEHFDLAIDTGKGHRREAGFNLVRVNATHDAEVHCVFLFRDIGDRRQYELELRRLKALSALGQMAAGFAHEVRNPLAAMRSLNDCLLLELDGADPRREYSMRMLSLIGRIESLVDHSLRYARPRPPERSSVDPRRIVHGALETLAPRVRTASHVAIAMEPMRELPRVRVDEAQMVQVLVILIENALDATGDPKRVRVEMASTTHENEALVGLHVVDDGPGVDEATMQLVFDPFFTTKPKGTGLGLAIAQRLMRDNGGHLLAVSEPHKRTVFSLLMPVVQDGPAGGPPRTA